MEYSVIVVDDEEIIREGLKKFINKKIDGFNAEFCFEDGSDAIEFLKANPIDVVLTDIKMSSCSGLEVAKYVRENLPDTEIVILSGYREFEYARRAMSCGVKIYLLKPATNEEIFKTFIEIKDILDRRAETSRQLNHYSELIDHMRERFFVDLLFGWNKSVEDSEADFRKLGFNKLASDVYAMVVRIKLDSDFIENKWQYGSDRVNNIVLNYFLSDGDCVYAMLLESNIFLILSNKEYTDLSAQAFADWIYTQFDTEVEFNVLYRCKGIEELSGWKISEKTSTALSGTIKAERIKLLHTYIKLEMYDSAKELFYEIWYTAGSEFARETLLKITESADANTIKCKDIIYSNLSAAEIFEGVRNQMQNDTQNENEIINKIKEYIKANFNKDISLESVADKVYLHSVYMSRFFKQHTGESFSDYLLNVRMANAISLLKENKYKIFEISEMVGYKSAKYFSKQFKNYTGYTPKQYCRITWNYE